jgi:acyl-CoA reductase-like NAD-dependent aldehyde dehydrogenase
MQGEKYTAFTLRQPIGVVAGIVPWNFSLMIGVWKIGDKLANSLGLSTIVQPVVKAEPIFQTPIISEKFQGTIPGCN